MTDRTTGRAGTARVAVVGMGAITSHGPTADDLWNGARLGRVAITPVQNLDMSGLQTKLGGEVPVLPDLDVDYERPPDHRERALDLALVAAGEALAALPAGAVDPERIGVVLGTCNAGLLSAREWLRRQAEGLPADGRLAALITPGALADALAAAMGVQGPVLAVNTACASGANAIGIGADLIRLGRADAVLAGGTDALSDIVFAGFNALQSLSPLPAAPYSGNRQGLSLGEGSGMLLLVRGDLAARHALAVHALVAGYGLSADGFHTTAPRPDGSGAALAIGAALRAAGASPTDVGYLNGHGTGTAKNDSAESKAIAAALGSAAADVLVSSTKSSIGHLLGAAGAVEAIVTVCALRDQVAPPTAGYERPDPDCPLDYVPNDARPLSTDLALSNNFAFGGANACLALTRPGAAGVDAAPDPEPVVLTAVSALTAAGDGVEAAWRAASDPQPAPRPRHDDRVAQVVVDADDYLSRRDRRRMDRLSILSVVSAAKALSAAGVAANSPAAAACGVIFGTGAGPMEAIERFAGSVMTGGPAAADPGVFPNTVYNQAAGQVAMHLGLYGPTSTLSLGHATGAAAVAYAADLIRSGAAPMLLVTVTDTITPESRAAYDACRLVSRPADEDAARGRLTLAEGSVSLVLERRSTALARGAPILAEIAGTGFAADRQRGSRNWDGRGLERAMRGALAEADMSGTDVGELWLAGGGLTQFDRGESAAATRLFGTGSASPDRHAPKRTLGDAIGVGPALSLALAVRGWQERTPAPALINSSSLTGSHVALLIIPPGGASSREEDSQTVRGATG